LHAARLRVIFARMSAISYDSRQAPILFIADLHLDSSRPQAIHAFLRFLQTRASSAAALFILGDLFEAWIGDDARPTDDPIAPALAALQAHDTDVWLMHGNRDFLLGLDYAQAAGASLLHEPLCIEIDAAPIVLEHGDALCTDDLAYQAFRSQVRDSHWQSQFLALPIAERIEQANAARIRSGEDMAEKSNAIMDVNEAAVTERMQAFNVYHLIHGHTHRPAIHEFLLNEKKAQRMVLGDWFEQGSVLTVNDGDWQLESIPFATEAV